jgi:hypothetical protein
MWHTFKTTLFAVYEAGLKFLAWGFSRYHAANVFVDASKNKQFRDYAKINKRHVIKNFMYYMLIMYQHMHK